MSAADSFVQALDRMGHEEALGRSALALAASNIPVFPCAAGEKHPAVAGGFHAASAEVDQVRRWWTAMPNANIGIPTGAASGLVVVDVDVHSDVDGYAALERARRKGLVDGWVAAVATPSGGLHLYFPARGNTDQRSWQSARAGVDFRGDGGYIIVPPSSRANAGEARHYKTLQLARGTDSRLDSRRLRDFLDPPRRSAGPRGAASAMAPADLTRLTSWVSRLQEGERNHGVFWAACKMAEQDVPTGAALDALTAAGASAGLSEREVTTTVRSAYRSVHGPSPQRLPADAPMTPPHRPRPVTDSRALA